MLRLQHVHLMTKEVDTSLEVREEPKHSTYGVSLEEENIPFVKVSVDVVFDLFEQLDINCLVRL